MSIHVFGAVITSPGVAANNRGETEGNITTLQKLLWRGQVHTTVSAEAIRWALRYYWQMKEPDSVNRQWLDDKEDHSWQDEKWAGWSSPDGKTYIDDDLLGFMSADAAKSEGNDAEAEEEEKEKGKKKKAKEKGTCTKRRGVLEIARAISTLPFAGDITFNAKSGEKGRTSLYGTEVHATRYQYNFALTPERLRVKSRALDALDAIVNLGEVAGNHSRFLYDFSPESIILRITDDPAPRILYCFIEKPSGEIAAPDLLHRLSAGDIKEDELFVGGPLSDSDGLKPFSKVNKYLGVKEAFSFFQIAIKERPQ
jgi:CRISPR-associated protein Cst2